MGQRDRRPRQGALKPSVGQAASPVRHDGGRCSGAANDGGRDLGHEDGRHAVARLPEEPGGRRGDAGATAASRLPAGRPAERSGRRRRQHLCIHRQREARVDRRHPRDGPREGNGTRPASGRDRVSGPALRRRPAARDPRDRRDARDGSGGGDRPGRGRRADLARRSRVPAAEMGLRPPPAPCPVDPALARVREDQRGLRLHLLVLRDPATAGTAPQPRCRGHRGRGPRPRGAGRARDRPRRTGLDALRPRSRCT